MMMLMMMMMLMTLIYDKMKVKKKTKKKKKVVWHFLEFYSNYKWQKLTDDFFFLVEFREQNKRTNLLISFYASPLIVTTVRLPVVLYCDTPPLSEVANHKKPLYIEQKSNRKKKSLKWQKGRGATQKWFRLKNVRFSFNLFFPRLKQFENLKTATSISDQMDSQIWDLKFQKMKILRRQAEANFGTRFHDFTFSHYKPPAYVKEAFQLITRRR